jgi:hypothetical protein
MLASKDPEESIVLTFDFSAIAQVIANPEISVEVISGEDANPENTKSDDPQISGAKVLQRVVGGADGADYHFRCMAQSGTDKLVVPATLRVRKR